MTLLRNYDLFADDFYGVKWAIWAIWAKWLGDIKIYLRANFFISTLFKIISELKIFLSPSYFPLIRGYFFIRQKYCIIPMNKGRVDVDSF